MRWALVSLLALASCSDDAQPRHDGLDSGVPGATEDGGSIDGGGSSLGKDARTADSTISRVVVADAGTTMCGNVLCACNNGIDDDADGLPDMADPECVSAWDNDEGSLATGIPGDNRDDACQDCFFDGNSGAGDDGCRVPSSCLTAGNASSGQGGCNSCETTTKCQNFCEAYTPNGCDCFGCCTIQLGSNISKNVLLSEGCSIDGTTVTGCTECVPSTTCVNTCGRCELCPGKVAQDLPADCQGAGADAGAPSPTCDDGEQRCGEGLPACDSGQACSFGCCVYVPVI